jgi:NTE family protein
MTTAFVLSGGGSLGAVQVGMLEALADRGIRPDLLVGTSVGALNAAFVAGHGADPSAMAELRRVWQSVRSRRLFHLQPRRAVLALLGQRPSVFSPDGLDELIRGHLTFDRLEDAPIPLTLVASDLLTGEEVPLTHGSVRRAIAASCAIPGVFPPVEIDGRLLVDGALANNAALSVAAEVGADRIFVLSTGYSCALSAPPRSALGVLAQASTLLLHQRLVQDVRTFAGSADLVVLPPPCPIQVSALDFRHAAALAAAGRASAGSWLDRQRGRAAVPGSVRAGEIALHVHRR